MQSIFDDLNSEQIRAVKHIDGPLLIVAGAGSGKTKTITSRLAYMIDVVGIVPSSILTLTFTNKAALEMRSRALSLIESNSSYNPLLCTFHKFGLIFLKFHMDRLGRDNSFVIIDSDDKKRIIKSFESDLPVSLIASEISKYKNNLIEPLEAISSAILTNYKHIANMYKKYQDYLTTNNLVDFDDLLLLPYKILDEDRELAYSTSQRYQYIMVDEYQDTNDLQFKLLQKLSISHNNICVVGDDDQSIYGWRGANIQNILDFSEIYGSTEVIKLIKNYRSTKNILKLASDLISFNKNRIDKRLEATVDSGKDIEVLSSSDEKEEAYKIANRIKELIDSGKNPNDIAILFRINALSRSIEDGLNRTGISYKVVGGLKFYERAEIKDIISYLRLIENKHDDFSLKRVINRPKRGVGKATIDKIYSAAYDRNISVYSYLKDHIDDLDGKVPKKTYSSLEKFIVSLDTLVSISKDSLHTLVDCLEDEFNLKDYYGSLPDAADKKANIDEFYGLFRDFVANYPDISLESFLNDIALESDQDQLDNRYVSLMSIHASKGLEFEYLFIIGLEEGFFPLLSEGTDLEEERRLGYVAITRAKKELVLSYSASRYYKGKRSHLLKSRFINEVGLGDGALTLQKSSSYKKGDLVRHKIFGAGRVINVGRVQKEYKLTINFGGITKEIMSNFVVRI
jgi:DNA helicase-2/ATP-dependent DNA helicase PcrA